MGQILHPFLVTTLRSGNGNVPFRALERFVSLVARCNE